MKSLDQELVDRYHSEGYLFPFRAFSAEAAASYRAEVERTCATTAGPAAAASGTLSYRVKPYLLFPWAAAMVREQAILDAVEDLIGPDILVFHTTMWWKVKGSRNRVPWHQDGTYFGLAPFEHVTAWVALSPSNTWTGCVRDFAGVASRGANAAFRSSGFQLDAIARTDGDDGCGWINGDASCSVTRRILVAPYDDGAFVRSEHR